MPGLITSCGGSSWYVFADAETGIGKIWSAMLITAQCQARNVPVRGTGVCWSLTSLAGAVIEIEGVKAIDISE